MPSSTHRVEPLTWCVVKPNSPVAGRLPTPGPTPLRFLAAARRPLAPGADEPEAQELLGTLFQAVGPVMIEVPLASELAGPPALMGFVPRRHQA